jgi:hypothetical protein
MFFSFKEMEAAFDEDYQDKILCYLKQKFKILKPYEVKDVTIFVEKTKAHIKTIVNNNISKWSKTYLSPAEHDQTYIGKRVSDDMFRVEKSPIIIVDTLGRLKYNFFKGTHNRTVTVNSNKTVTVNPRLQDYSFVSVIDPITAFQEISAFLGSNLVEQKDPNPHMSDELKSEIHGFDKWSFRKPSKKST